MGEAILKYLAIVVVLVAFNEVIITQGRQIKISNQNSKMNKDTSIDNTIPTSLGKDDGDSNGDHLSAHRPTTPGNSPGVGHKIFGVEKEDIKAKMVAVESPDAKHYYFETSEESKPYYKSTDPGHSPGVGHAVHQNKVHVTSYSSSLGKILKRLSCETIKEERDHRVALGSINAKPNLKTNGELGKWSLLCFKFLASTKRSSWDSTKRTKKKQVRVATRLANSPGSGCARKEKLQANGIKPSSAFVLHLTIYTSFPYLKFQIYPFDDLTVAGLISTSIGNALDCPLNYACNYLPSLLPPSVHKVVYLDSNLVIVDDTVELAATPMSSDQVLAPHKYCNANFTTYFTLTFWSNPSLSLTFAGHRKPCNFNTRVMVIDLERWRAGDYTRKIEEWMEPQKRIRIYELGSLPPFLLVFIGNIAPVDHKRIWIFIFFPFHN
ncbi:hypothetical protein K1719_015336 [Acacia pycnantha]|nr:hypothetical protein K1719_015336 [Acacia pycnantha]